MKRRTVVIVSIIAVIVLTGIYFIRHGATSTSETGQSGGLEKSPTVRVIPASKASLSQSLSLTGTAEPYREAQLASPAEGPVLALRVREGDQVHTGDLLLSIGRKTGTDALISSLEKELKTEADNVRRTRQLVEKESIPAEELDRARTAYEKVKAQLIQMEEKARDYDVTAPWDGVVSRVAVKAGQFVGARTVLLEMYDPASMVIRAAVPEKHALRVTVGMSVDVKLDAYPDTVIRGHIARVYPYLDSRLRTRTIEIEPDTQVTLLPGMFARVQILLQTVEDVVVVPEKAVLRTPNGQQMVFVAEEGRALRKSVETGIREGDRIQISSGIQHGDRVIVAGHEKLRDGAAVSITGGGRSPAESTGDAGRLQSGTRAGGTEE